MSVVSLIYRWKVSREEADATYLVLSTMIVVYVHYTGIDQFQPISSIC